MDLEHHILDVHWNKQYKCEKCPFATCSVGDYNVHIKTMHETESNCSPPVKSILKKKETAENEMDLDSIIKDLNTLLNGSKVERETKLITAVRNLVKVNQKYSPHVCDERESDDEEEIGTENYKDHTNSIFLSHHEADADEDVVEINSKILDIFFTEDEEDNSELNEEEKKEIVKLHKYFAHRSGRKLWENLFLPAGKLRGKKKLVLDYLDKCDSCRKHRKTPARPKVGLPKFKDVNEVVSMDLKILKKSGKKETDILYLHDEFSKLIRGQVINDKNPDTIIKAIENKWIIGGGIGPDHPP